MAPNPAEPDQRLLRAAAASHRRWFREAAPENRLVEGGADADELVRAAREGGPRGLGAWSMTGDDELGVRLVARGFEWGWQPHWMGLELEDGLESAVGFDVVAAEPPFAKTLPYRLDGSALPAGAIHLGVRLREKIVGQVVVLPGDEGVAGIFAMGVAPKAQRRGIGLALTQAALRAAREHGCDAAVLNATPEGERVYTRAGFRSLGWGQTWWWPTTTPSPPTDRQIQIAEAIGTGDVEALAALAPSEAEATAAIPLAVITGQAATINRLLEEFPALAERRFPDDGGNLLHLAVERDRPEVADVALRHGVDRDARDATYDATPAGWAEHLGRPELARLVT